MTIDSGNANEEEVTVRMPTGMLDGVDALRVRGGYGTRSQVVTEAIRRAAERR